jgi:hypothetical protein
MQIFWGTVLVASSLLCWGGQTIVCFASTTGARLGLSEREADVEPTFWADVRSEALWDFLTLWTLVAAGALLIIDHPAWGVARRGRLFLLGSSTSWKTRSTF